MAPSLHLATLLGLLCLAAGYPFELLGEEAAGIDDKELPFELRSDIEGGDPGARFPNFVRQAHPTFTDGLLEEDEDWPANGFPVGQIGGVATDGEGQVHVFHRADRPWGDKDFDEKHVYQHQKRGPIAQTTLLAVDGDSGKVLGKGHGRNRFYIPHGLTIDAKGNFWVTDVALHQVFKFSDLSKEPELSLGLPFQPAHNVSDAKRFCKPTDVAVASNGDFFVADGYCNSRIVKFNSKGQPIAQFGENELDVPHSLALIEERDLLCVADRENLRIVCYKAGLKGSRDIGRQERQYQHDDRIDAVYAIDYSPKTDLLYAVNGYSDVRPVIGFTIDMDEEGDNLINSWKPQDGFLAPHDLAVSADGESVFVGELASQEDDETAALWKLDRLD